MKRTKLVLSIAAAMAVMSIAGAPAMADVEIDSSGSSNGFTSVISSSSFGDSSDNFTFFSVDSDFDNLDVEGSHFDFD